MRGPFFVYILASARNGTLYTGVTNDLAVRVWQHRQHDPRAFTTRYQVHRLVWYEAHDSIEDAIRREKAIKKWRRQFKLRVIEAMNPDWDDLWPGGSAGTS